MDRARAGCRAVTDTDDETEDSDNPVPSIQVNRYFADHPEMVLGETRSSAASMDLPDLYCCRQGGADLEHLLAEALDRLPDSIFIVPDESRLTRTMTQELCMREPRPMATIKEGSFCSAIPAS